MRCTIARDRGWMRVGERGEDLKGTSQETWEEETSQGPSLTDSLTSNDAVLLCVAIMWYSRALLAEKPQATKRSHQKGSFRRSGGTGSAEPSGDGSLTRSEHLSMAAKTGLELRIRRGKPGMCQTRQFHQMMTVPF